MIRHVMKAVTKADASKPRKCRWCGKRFKPKTAGRPAQFCNASCRQRAYEKRTWAPFTESDALALDLLPPAAYRRLVKDVRHAHMIELIINGTVPLTDPAQIDGVLDPLLKREQMRLLSRIESACQSRGDNLALQTLARWRFQRQSRRRSQPK